MNLKNAFSLQQGGAPPSFTGRTAASPAASAVKGRNRSKNTRAERELRKALSKLGLRYRVHQRTLPGKPDIVFGKARIAVFCDGDFWHGRDWRARRSQLRKGSNADYWTQKIAYNIARDKRQAKQLKAANWSVIRFWETDVLRDPSAAADLVWRLLRRRIPDRVE